MSVASTENRSQSRGRDIYIASGRGGAGNIRSVSRDAVKANPAEYDDDSAIPRGREIDVSSKVLSSGRGGAGNIRPPSQDRSPSVGLDAREREIIAKRIAQDEAEGVHSSGRGGAGNIRSNSRSRSRPPTDAAPVAHPHLHSSGRGGAGNITSLGPDAAHLAKVEEAEAAAYADHEPKYRSTGRGGAANFTNAPVPRESYEAGAPRSSSRGPVSSGRGGAGNIHTPEGEAGERGREPHKGLLNSVLDKVRTSTSRSRNAE